MIVLADTSVWVDHFRRRNDELAELLENGSVVMHSAIRGELACGSLTNRELVLEYLSRLESMRETDPQECLALIENQKLWSLGLGWIDVQLLASCLINAVSLWTLDRALEAQARRLRTSWH